jgi:hypothetical protein
MRIHMENESYLSARYNNYVPSRFVFCHTKLDAQEAWDRAILGDAVFLNGKVYGIYGPWEDELDIKCKAAFEEHQRWLQMERSDDE